MQKRLFQVLHTAPEAIHAPCGDAPGNPDIHGIRVTDWRKTAGGTGCSQKPGQQLYDCGISEQNGRAACSSLQPDVPLRDWKKHQDELKEFLGDEYQDFNLVVALQNGRPCEGRVLLKSFEELRTRAKLPNVVFHSLRHSSTTYKLKLNHGDIKATQGDTGHAQTDMITEIYSHILDEDRKVNAQKFEAAFYKNPDLRKSGPPASDTQTNSGDILLELQELVYIITVLCNHYKQIM